MRLSSESLVNSLFLAIKEKNLPAVIALVSCGAADLTQQNDDEQTPIKYAVNQKYWTGVRAIAENANKLVLDNDVNDEALFCSALLRALDAKQFDIARLLLERHTHIDDMWNFTSTRNYMLHVAVVKGAPVELVALLLIRGANPNKENKKGETPLDLAISLKRDSIVHCLSDADSYTRSIKAFLMLYVLKLMPSDCLYLCPELIERIVSHIGYDKDFISLYKSVEKDIALATESILEGKEKPDAIHWETYYSVKKSMTKQDKINYFMKKAQSCTTDKEKSIYIHRLLDQSPDTVEDIEDILLLLETMTALYPKEKYIFPFFNKEEASVQSRKNCIITLSEVLIKKIGCSSPIAYYMLGMFGSTDDTNTLLYLKQAQANNKALGGKVLTEDQLHNCTTKVAEIKRRARENSQDNDIIIENNNIEGNGNDEPDSDTVHGSPQPNA